VKKSEPKTKLIGLSMPHEIVELLQAEAQMRYISLSDVIREKIIVRLVEEGKLPKEAAPAPPSAPISGPKKERR